MPGASDYTAKNVLSYLAGQIPMPSMPALYMALFTTAPTGNSGSGGTEVSGTGYARVQVSGSLAISGSTSTSSTTFTLSSDAPAWLAALGATPGGGGGVTVWSSAGVFIGTIAANGVSTSSTTVTLTSDAAAVASGTLLFSAFAAESASSGTEPAVTPANIASGAVVNFAQAGSGGWGTALAWAFYDALTGGDFLIWDGLGNYKWQAFTCSDASPGVLSVDTSGDAYANGTTVIVTQKYGSTLPSLSTGSWAGPLTTAGLSSNTFNVSLNTTSTGAGLIRQIQEQSIPANVTASIAAGQLVVSLA